MPYTSPHETLATAASWPISKVLAARVVLGHPHAAFYPCMCGFYGGVVVLATALIDYINRGGCCCEDHKEEVIVIDYFPYTDVRLHSITAPTLLSLLSVSIGNDDL
jgi:hypothetical protein